MSQMKKLKRIGIALLLSMLCYMPLVADAARSEKLPAVDAEQYADSMANEVLDVEDLADGAETQRRFFDRITPPGVSLLQPMFPSVAPFDAANFSDVFLDGLLGEDENSVVIYPLSLLLDPKTGETLIYNAEGKLIASVPPLWGPRIEPEGSDPSRVTLLLELLPLEDVEPYLYTEARIFQTLLSIARTPKDSGGISQKSMGCGSNEFGIVNIQKLTNGAMRITVSEGTNEINIAEMFSYTVEHSSSVSGSNTLWTPVSPSFNGNDSAWEFQTTNLVLTNGVGVWEDSNISSNARVRFYGVAERTDTDEDVLTDGAEFFVHHTDPNNDDSDGDGLLDGLEVNVHSTDPNNSDTDGDELPDGWEVQNGLDPHDDGTTNIVNGAEGDPDDDGFDNALEFELGAPANNPAWNGNELVYRLMHATEVIVTNTRSITTNLIGMKVKIEDSENCGGANDQRQVEVDTLDVPDMLAWGYFIDITVAGDVEDKDDYYDQVHIRAFTNTYYFEGSDNQNLCPYMASKTTNCNVLILENSTVVLEYDTMSYMYHVDAYAEITEATVTGHIKSETKATFPTNRARREVGVAEEVDITITPDPSNVTWSVSGGGSLNTNTGPNVIFTASSNASTCPVTINFLGHSITKNFEVKEPIGVVDASISSRMSYPLGEAGAGMWLVPVVIGPTNVSFYQVQIVEVGRDATNCFGYFVVNPPSPHTPKPWAFLNPANQWADEAKISGSHVTPPWYSGGRFEWPIPAQWRIGSNGPPNSMTTGWNQVFDIEADGTVKISKFGKWVKRTTNNVITNN